ncbi:hypothetical protein E2C01_083811 [Portunus trituberculatus]|uniref:Uncharacterized protein n=1 Tax=Portunus trituberculatus TaxID=210409 RepID=A0A5B7J7K2_PORTR|nr:hypothetical protein [Portunus trituberculatus]
MQIKSSNHTQKSSIPCRIFTFILLTI